MKLANAHKRIDENKPIWEDFCTGERGGLVSGFF
jgi:hypothetical protein